MYFITMLDINDNNEVMEWKNVGFVEIESDACNKVVNNEDNIFYKDENQYHNYATVTNIINGWPIEFDRVRWFKSEIIEKEIQVEEVFPPEGLKEYIPLIFS